MSRSLLRYVNGLLLMGWGRDYRRLAWERIKLRSAFSAQSAYSLIYRVASYIIDVEQKVIVGSEPVIREVSVHGARLCLNLVKPHDFRMYLRSLARMDYEPATTELLLDSLHPGDDFIDVGANNGYYSMVAAVAIGGSGRIWAFEPNPEAFESLRRNAEKLPRQTIRLFKAALSDKSDGTAPIYIDGDSAHSSLVRRARRETLVRLIKGDDVLPSNLTGILKMDVEGGEFSALQGLARTLESSPGLELIVEWNSEFRASDLGDFLFRDYQVSVIGELKGGRYELIPITSSIELPQFCNLYCRSKQRRTKSRSYGQ